MPSLPDDVSLEPVDHDPFAGQPSAADVQSMTHQAPGPNPAKSVLDALRAFMAGGLQGVANVQGINTPDWSKKVGALLSSPEANAAIGMATPLGKGITAFHGSPHDFDAFDISKIGTGEGAQAYGHGLYFAENEGVAKSYRDAAHVSPSFWFHGDEKLTGARNNAAQFISDNGNDQTKALAEIGKLKELYTKQGGDPAWLDQTATEVGKLDPSKLEFRNPGKMYQVNINADPEHFLDWDKSLSEQHPKVQEAIQNRVAELTADDPGPRRGGKHILQSQVEQDATGGDIYGRLAYKQGAFPEIGVQDHAAATDALRAAGIPGIKYLDQGSRFAGTQGVAHLQNQISQLQNMLKTAPAEKTADIQRALAGRQSELAQAQNGTRNYVVFDDKLIDIMKKYGIAGIGALPAMGAYHYQTNQVDHDPFAEQQ